MRPTKPIEVLLVEDNAADIFLTRQALAEETIPVSMHVAVDGEQALDMLAGHHFNPDLVILDLKVPKLDGLSLLERSHPNIPVVVFSHPPALTTFSVRLNWA